MAAIAADGRRNMLPVFRFSKKDHAATAARTAHLGRQSALAERNGDKLFDHWGADPGGVRLAQLPFFADQLGYLLPVGHGKGVMHGPGDLADPFKVVEDFLVAI